RNGVVAKSLDTACHLRTARIETQDRGDDRIKTLRLGGDARVWTSSVAEAVIAAARVEKSVVGIARVCRRLELERSHWMRQIGDDVSLAQQLTLRSFENIGGGIRGVPFRDDVVVRHIFQSIPRRNEVGCLRIARPALRVNGVKQSVLHKLGMKHE